jgi:Protein of unknown function (DUF2911)
MRLLTLFVFILSVLSLPSAAVAQEASNSQSFTACSFDDGTEISVRYDPSAAGHDKDLPNGKLFPVGSPMLIFTQSETVIGGSTVPIGAFSLYVIPGKDTWTLIVNRNVTPGAKYDQTQDLARAPMETAKLPQPLSEIKVSLGHMGPKRCELRFYYGKVGAWAELNEK